MSEEKKPKVETSIELIDGVTDVATKIKNELESIALKYEEVNNRLSGGLTIGYNNTNTANTTKTIENMYTNATNKISTSLKNRLVGTLGDLEKYNQLIKEANLEQERHARVSLKQAKERDTQRAQRQKLTLANPKQQKEVLSQSTTSAESKANKLYFKSFEEKLRYFERDNNLKSMANHEQERHANELISQSATRISQSWERISITRERNAERERAKDKAREQKELASYNDRILKQEKFEEDARRKEEKFYNNMIQMLDKHDVKMGIAQDNFDFTTKKHEEKVKRDREKTLQKKADEDRKYAHEQRMLDLQKEKHKDTLEYYDKRREQINIRALERLNSNINGKKSAKNNKLSIDLSKVFDTVINKMSIAFKTIFNPNNIKIAIDSSDAFVKINTRIDKLNEAFNKRNGTNYTTDSLMDYIYKSSQNARVNYYDMATTVAGVGTYSDGVFNNQKEVVSFTELLFKVLRTNGIDSDNSYSSVKQITTAMNRGELKGEQLIMLLKNAPSIINMVTQTLKISQQELEKMAREGKISSRALKDVIFVNSKEISDEFNKIPMTWQDVHTRMSNIMLKTFEPVLLRINELANDKKFIANIDKISKKMSELTVKIVDFFAKFINNWERLRSTLIGVGLTLLSLKGIALSFEIASFATELGGLATSLGITSGGLVALTGALGSAAVGLGVFSAAIAAVGIIAAIDKNAIMDAKRYEEYRYGDMLGEKSGTFLNPKLRGTEKSFYEDRGVEWNNGILTYGDKFEQLHNERIEKLGLSNLYNNDNQYTPYIDEVEKYMQDMIAEMQKANSSLDITTEDLKYMRDIAERDNINRFTTAEIKVDMQNNNNINNNMDIDGVVSQLAEGIEEAMYVVAEGVY